MPDSNDALPAVVAKIGLARSTRHVFLCLGPTCCAPAAGEAAWETLKRASREAGLTEGASVCQRTKVGCLRICCAGPTMVVYPEGTWYANMTAERIPRFVREHLVAGQPIREWIFAEKRLDGQD